MNHSFTAARELAVARPDMTAQADVAGEPVVTAIGWVASLLFSIGQ